MSVVGRVCGCGVQGIQYYDQAISFVFVHALIYIYIVFILKSVECSLGLVDPHRPTLITCWFSCCFFDTKG